MNRGAAKAESGNKQQAIEDYDRAISLDPELALAYYNRGSNKYKLGDKQAAITDTSKAAELFRKQGQMEYYQKAMDFLKKVKR